MHDTNNELKDLDYELFFLGISALSFVNVLIALLAPDRAVRNVARIVDTSLAMLYIVDFGYRLISAPSKRSYFVRQFGWADLLAAVPLPGFQLFRIVRSSRTLLLARRGEPGVVSQLYRRDRARTTLLSVFLMIAFVIEFGAIGMIIVERGHPDANILNASDALWWSYETITTVGFGDKYPVTSIGRLVGVGMLTAGVGLFSVLTGFLANAFLAPRRHRMQAAEDERDKQSHALRELVQLLEEHERRMAELRARIAELEQAELPPAVKRGEPEA